MFYESTFLTCRYPSVTFIYESIGTSESNKLSGVVAHNLSGLKVILQVTDEADRVDAGDPEDAI